MRVELKGRIRYKIVALVEGQTPAILDFSIRLLVFCLLILLFVPLRVVREVSFGSRAQKLPLKHSLRITVWIWNRSWMPVRLGMNTFFDLGWSLSLQSCECLRKRGFVSDAAVQRNLDLAQLQLAAIRASISAGDSSLQNQADQDLVALVSKVFNAGHAFLQDHCEEIADSGESQSSAGGISNQGFNNDRPGEALRDFANHCEQMDLEFFLVSGTFLGAVREKNFLGHDHDIDVGVDSEGFGSRELESFRQSRLWVVTETETVSHRKAVGSEVRYERMQQPALVRLAHKNGICVDIFVHFHDQGWYWHGSRVHRWNNRPFELAAFELNGETYNGAMDFDLYLSENYGADWRIPKTQFNVNFDTPNLSFAGTANALVFFAWAINAAMSRDDRRQVAGFIDQLLGLGVIEISNGQVRVR